MIQLPSYKLIDWPFKDYTYIRDLIEFEGPILVHYMNEKSHALYYWVEGDSSVNRWLCFGVTLSELYDYLKQNISLYDLISNKEREAFYITDIDNELKYGNFQMLNGYSIPEEYMPDKDSYYISELPDFYDDLFRHLDKDSYLEFMKMREICLEIKPHKNSPHGDIVSMTDSIDFLNGINNSYKNFVAFKFYNTYKDRYSDAKALLKATNKIIEASELRVVGAQQHSFQISVATDRIIELDPQKEYNDFSEGIINQYHDDVLSIDLNSEETASLLIEKYDDETRNKIFQPLIRIINNTNCDLSIIDKRKNKRKSFSKINPVIKSKILQKTPRPQPPDDLKKVFYTITLELNENTDLTTISKKEIQQSTLFSKVSQAAQQEIQKFNFDSFTVIFKRPILLDYVSNDNGSFSISFPPLNIEVTGTARNNAFEKVMDAFESLIQRDYLSKVPQKKENKAFFEQHVSEIIFNQNI